MASVCVASGTLIFSSPLPAPALWGCEGWFERLLIVPLSNRIEVCTLRYHFDTIVGMAMTLRLTDDEHAALRERAEAEGISMQEAARRAVRDFVARGAHRDRVSDAAQRVIAAHAEALDRLGQ